MVGETVAVTGVLLSGTVLDWGDAYAGISSQVQLGAPNPSVAFRTIMNGFKLYKTLQWSS